MASPKRGYLHPRHGYVEVKQGFSWPAFFIGSLWASVKRLWIPTFALMVLLDSLLWFISGYAEAQRADGLALLGGLAGLAYAIARGWWGNRLWERALLARGYQCVRPAAPPGSGTGERA